MEQLRDFGLVAILFAVLIGFTIWGPGRNQPSDGGRRGSTHSKAEDGSLGLQLWLRTLGYRAENLEYEAWSIPLDTDVLMMIGADMVPIEAEERDEILDWVQAGGTLISIAERPTLAFAPQTLWQEFGAQVVAAPDEPTPAERADAVQPVLLTPPVASVPVQTINSIEVDEPGFVTLLETRFGPTLIGRQLGRGYVYLGVSAEPFTNRGLQQPGSGALLLNLISRIPAAGTILFDEYHHGFRTAPSAPSLLTGSWWGYTIMYTLLVLGLFAVLTGRRFGRPIPVRQEVARRSSAEYVLSMAQLFQRAGKRRDIADHYHAQLKRRVAQPYGFVPPQDDAQFLQELDRWGNLTPPQHEQLAALLAELRHPKLTEAELVRLARAADALVGTKGRFK